MTVDQTSQENLNEEVRRLKFLLGLTERLQSVTDLPEIGQFALSYLVEAMGASFGDIKVITGEGENRQAGMLLNQVSSQFLATYGEAIINMEKLLQKGIPHGQGLLWQVVETGEPILVEDYSSHPQAIPTFQHPGISQLGIFPIPSANGKIIGVLTIESRSEQKLEDALQQDMLLAACRTLGFAIERARGEEQLRKANEELEQASRMKSEFLASMSHELRTPLNSIIGFSELLLRQSQKSHQNSHQKIQTSLSSRQVNHIQTIVKSGQHLLELINDILDLSKIEAGKTELELKSVSIQGLCNECLKMIQPRAEKKRLALSLELDYRLEEVLLDERRVRQILINLLANGVKFTPERGKIKLSGKLAYGWELQQESRPDCSPVNPSTPYLCLEVRDTGIGIAAEKQHLLFSPFQQIDSSLTRRHEGTGLGLVLTKRLAELHGGTVSVESVENEGSAFRVWLPITEMRQVLNKLSPSLSPEKDSSPQKEKPSNNNLDRKRILVVEDQPFNQASISEVLELQGYEVEIVYDGDTMMDLIDTPLVSSKILPDLILMDIHLPGVDGLEIIRRLRKLEGWRDLPVIAVTAMAMQGDRDRCLEAGANDYASKPLDIDGLVESIQSLLEKGDG